MPMPRKKPTPVSAPRFDPRIRAAAWDMARGVLIDISEGSAVEVVTLPAPAPKRRKVSNDDD